MVIQPLLTQQLGIFSTIKLNPLLLKEFYLTLKKINTLTYNFNLFYFSKLPFNFKYKKLLNTELYLNEEYNELRKAYSKNTIRNISKAKKENLYIVKLSPNKSAFYFLFSNMRFPYTSKEQILIKNIIINSFHRQEGLLIACNDSDNKTLLSLAFFIIYNNRITFLVSSCSEEGYKKRATFIIFDKIIRTYSNSNFILDFDGSMHKGIMRFYKGFGGKEKAYGQIISKYYNIFYIFKKISNTIFYR
jgi:hypothetical protein